MIKKTIRAILSTLLILIFLTLVFTGALMYFGKTGVILGFSRHLLREAHFWIAVSMLVITPAHIALNLRIYRAELLALTGKRGRGTWKRVHGGAESLVSGRRVESRSNREAEGEPNESEKNK